MKKLLVLLFAFVMSVVLVACGEDKQNNSNTDTTKSGTDSQSVSSDLADSEGSEVTFTLYNTTEYDLTSVSLSKAGKDKWGETLINETLKAWSNTSVKIKVPADPEDRRFDVLAKDTSGNSYTFHYLDFSELDEKGGTISLALTEGGGGFAMFSKPYVEPTLKIDSAPAKLKYKVGEAYDPTGFSATYTDEDGEEITLDADDVKFIVSGTVEITAGRAFTTAGKKTVVVQYFGLTEQFELTVE